MSVRFTYATALTVYADTRAEADTLAEQACDEIAKSPDLGLRLEDSEPEEEDEDG